MYIYENLGTLKLWVFFFFDHGDTFPFPSVYEYLTTLTISIFKTFVNCLVKRDEV